MFLDTYYVPVYDYYVNTKFIKYSVRSRGKGWLIMKTSMSIRKKGILFRIQSSLRRLADLLSANQKFTKKNAQSRDIHSACSKQYLEVYLFYPLLNGRRERRGDFKNFFEQGLNDIDEAISGQPVFLDQSHALWYSRYMGEGHGILKAYVAEHAIEGRSQELWLKSGFLTKELIHGCYPGWAKGNQYVPNPVFNHDEVAIN